MISLCIASESYTSMRASIYDVSLSFSLERRRLSPEEFNVVRKLRKALTSTYEIPAVYIHFGKQIPAYLEYSVEMTATNNVVIVLSDAFEKTVFHVPIGPQMSKNLSLFEKHYRPIRLNGDPPNRQHYELQCIERWLVLYAFAVEYNVSRLFYGDNDNVLYGNVSTVLNSRKWLHHFANGSEDNDFNRLKGGTCEAMVSVSGYMSIHDFLGAGSDSNIDGNSSLLTVAGHGSYWTLSALEDLSDFIMNIYLNDQYQELIALKKEKLLQRRGGDRIVDMHLLYLWWVAHHNISD
eukprot:gene32830-43887_t